MGRILACGAAESRTRKHPQGQTRNLGVAYEACKNVRRVRHLWESGQEDKGGQRTLETAQEGKGAVRKAGSCQRVAARCLLSSAVTEGSN